MKKGLKFWSKLLIASFFLGGMATSAIAQNGATTANCGSSLITVTRTAQQLNEGTEITLNFSGTEAGNSYYFVAQAGGSLLTVTCDNTIGKNLQVEQVNGANNTITGTESPIVAAGTFADGNTDGKIDSIVVKVKSVTALADEATTLKLGVFVKDRNTGCFSDVNWVTIQVLGNIYASLTLNNGNPYEYICSGATTNTNIGFTLCNLPAVTETISTGTLNYTVTATPTANITGQRVYASGNTGADLDANDSPWNATISGIDAEDITIGSYTYSKAYTVQIGTQTLSNANIYAAEQIVYSFSNMTYTYTDNGRTVVLPIVFETESAKCNDRGIYETEFTVHVAPSFGVSTLAHSTSERNDATPDFEFCQGTIAYLLSTTTATQGTITNWTWSVTGTSANSIEAGAKIGDGTTTPLLTYAATEDDDRVENRVQVGQLTDITAGVYKYTLVGKWDLDSTPNNFFDTIKEGVGCTATSEISIVVTPAPILLLATDKADMSDAGLADNTILWNTTDVITVAETYCPGQEVYINTVETGTPLHDGSNRQNVAESGDYIKHNGASITWTIDVPSNMGAYTEWRVEPGLSDGATGTIAADHASPNTNVTHYLNNESIAAPGNIITYTVQSAGECALVKTDGSSLTDGKVQIKYPVSIRPTFDLSAN